MSVVTKGNVSVQVCGLLKHKPLPGDYGVLFDGNNNTNQPPRIDLHHWPDVRTPVHVIHLQQLKFSNKTIRNDEKSFVLSVKKEKHQFQFDTMDDKVDWINALCHVSTELLSQRASAKELSDADDADASKGMEDNLIYDSSDRVQQFKVSIIPTRAAESNGLKGHFLLNPGVDSLFLLEIAGLKSIHDWPYRQIRKYGRSHNIFRMEVGRKCTTGAGEFEFFTPQGELLTQLIAKYAAAVREKDSKHDEIPHLNPLQAPHRGSGSFQDSRDRESMDVFPARSSSVSLTGKPDIPIPARRSKFSSVSKQEHTSGEDKKKEPSTSSDTKIYETSSGLTAPLEANLKDELSSKLHVSVPMTIEETQSLNNLQEKNDVCPPKESAESDSEKRTSVCSLKDKKKSDKEKRKLEKKQEKEREKEKERQAREQKEREKQQKKESKSHNKLTGKKSNTPTPVCAALTDGGNIYDEPEELLKATKTKVLDNHEDEPTPASLPGDLYASPQKPNKDGWKKHAIEESEDVHQEDYAQIKSAAMNQASSLPPPRSKPFPRSNPDEDESYDIYNHLRYLPKPQVLHPPENVYGMASAVQTITADEPLPGSRFVTDIDNDYEEAEDVNPQFHPSYTSSSQGNEYETTDMPPFQRPEIISNPDTGDYVDVK